MSRAKRSIRTFHLLINANIMSFRAKHVPRMYNIPEQSNPRSTSTIDV